MRVASEQDAKIFFRNFLPEGYQLPFSYLRGSIVDESELPDIEKVVLVLFA